MADTVRVAARAAVIECPVHAVWTFMIDASNMSLWEDSGAAWTQTSKGPVALDTTFESSIRKLGREIKFPLRVTEFDLDKTFGLEVTSGFAKGTKFRYVNGSGRRPPDEAQSGDRASIPWPGESDVPLRGSRDQVGW